MLYPIAATSLIQSAVLAHPGGYKDEQLRAIRVPVSWALAEGMDPFACQRTPVADCSPPQTTTTSSKSRSTMPRPSLPSERARPTTWTTSSRCILVSRVASLSARLADAYLQGTAHGFAARPNLAYPEVKAGYEGAFEQAVQWFKKTLF